MSRRRSFKKKEQHQKPKQATRTATVQKNPKGFAFLVFDDRAMEDLFVPPPDARSWLHADRVEVTLDPRGRILSAKVIERKLETIFGTFTQGQVLYQGRKSRDLFPIRSILPGINEGDWVKAKLFPVPRGPSAFAADILEVLGPTLPAKRDVEMLAAEFGWHEHHSERAENEARALKLELENLGSRKDIRSIPLITIDGATARDFDDAVWVERSREGFRLVVAIADVSHYVTMGGSIDQEAYARATSVYFPERAFHMLPRALSENLCSLVPNQPRYCMVADMRFDVHGKRISTELYEGLMQSRRRATYEEIQTEYEKVKAGGSWKSWEFAAHFDLYKLLRETMKKRGSIDFDLPESQIVVEADGEPKAIELRPRLDAHRLIEVFMIAANECVTEWAVEHKAPFLYRVHEEPDLESLKAFQKLATTMGVQVNFNRNPPPKLLADLVRKLEKHPAEFLLNSALLRSMKQAHYTSKHTIHYGLASTAYTHFTSPIRRYPDLIVHRLIKSVLTKRKSHPKEEIEKLAVHCSYRERLSTDTEREAIKLKQARYMHRHLGDVFEGRISGMTEKGLFVQILSPYVEGFLPQEALGGDRYTFNEERMTYHNKRKNTILRVGESITVQVARADVARRKIEFTSANPAELTAKVRG